jgi:hypothetical protein
MKASPSLEHNYYNEQFNNRNRIFMNQNTAVVIGVIVIALLLTGGLFFYKQSGTSGTATSTPTGDTPVVGTTPTVPVTRTPGTPTATTNRNVDPTSSTAVVVGGVIPNGALTSYWYEYGASANLGLSSTKQNIGSGYVELAAPAYITQLAKDSTYYFRLIAQNQFGKSTGATYTLHTDTSKPAPVGGMPVSKTLAASSISRTSSVLRGEVIPNKATTSYWFEYGETTSLGNTSALQSVGNGSATVAASLTLADLTPATTYYFRINAQNQFGTDNGAILNFKTSGPPISALPVVTTLVAGPVGTTTATLRGTVNPYSIQTTYWFEYSTNANFSGNSLKTTAHLSAGAVATTVSIETQISSLNARTTYHYRTVAQSSAGTARGESMTFKTN